MLPFSEWATMPISTYIMDGERRTYLLVFSRLNHHHQHRQLVASASNKRNFNLLVSGFFGCGWQLAVGRRGRQTIDSLSCFAPCKSSSLNCTPPPSPACQPATSDASQWRNCCMCPAERDHGQSLNSVPVCLSVCSLHPFQICIIVGWMIVSMIWRFVLIKRLIGAADFD